MFTSSQNLVIAHNWKISPLLGKNKVGALQNVTVLSLLMSIQQSKYWWAQGWSQVGIRQKLESYIVYTRLKLLFMYIQLCWILFASSCIYLFTFSKYPGSATSCVVLLHNLGVLFKSLAHPPFFSPLLNDIQLCWLCRCYQMYSDSFKNLSKWSSSAWDYANQMYSL